MKLIVGLGNPGKGYETTFHNAGFLAVDALSESFEPGAWKSSFKGKARKGRHFGRDYVLLKPETYMNLSGQSVLACKQFYKLELEDALVISDDMDLPLGTLRYRTSGGHGGHNGLRNIIDLCGGNRFHRLRIGIGGPKKRNATGHVLGKPAPVDLAIFRDAVEKTVEHQLDFILEKGIHITNP